MRSILISIIFVLCGCVAHKDLSGVYNFKPGIWNWKVSMYDTILVHYTSDPGFSNIHYHKPRGIKGISESSCNCNCICNK